MAAQKHILDVSADVPLSRVRQFVRGVEDELPDHAHERLASLVTEVVANATRHGQPPVELELTRLAGTARVAVRSGGPPFRWHGRSRWARRSEGWGLLLVDSMDDRWGIDRLAGCNQVWFEIYH